MTISSGLQGNKTRVREEIIHGDDVWGMVRLDTSYWFSLVHCTQYEIEISVIKDGLESEEKAVKEFLVDHSDDLDISPFIGFNEVWKND